MILDPKRRYDGYVTVEGGIDSNKSPSLINDNQFAWAVNTTMRGGYATCRPGFRKLALDFDSLNVQARFENGRFQGASSYTSTRGEAFLVSQHGGRLFAINLNQANSVSDISVPSDYNSSNQPKAWFQQAEYWLVVQDNQSKPILWDGSTSRRAVTGEVPVGGPMAYGKGRLWVAQGRSYVGGDLVWTDDALGAGSVINFTENTFIAEGGSFAVPSSSGSSITGMAFAANIDTSLGDGDLLVFTNRDIFAFDAPIDRTVWKDLDYPVQRFALMDYGTFSHTSIARVNGDLFFRSQDGIRSFAYARRDFIARWGNTPISSEITRALQYDTEYWLYASSAVNFDNRLLMTVSPQYTSHGVYHLGLASLDFDLISSMGTKYPPAWEGVWTGLHFLQLVKVVVSGVERCFAYSLNEFNVIEVWELTRSDSFDNNGVTDEPIEWSFETKNFDFAKANQGAASAAMEQKRLDGADLWVDSMFGEVTCSAMYRPDNQPLWNEWCSWSDCADSEDCADGINCHVPTQLNPQVRVRVALTTPPDSPDTLNGTFYRSGFEFQARITFTGKLVLRKMRLFASENSEEFYGQSKVTACVSAEATDCQTGECRSLQGCSTPDYDFEISDPDAHHPIEVENLIYWGRRDAPTLTPEEIELLTQVDSDTIVGAYDYPVGGGYLYLALPDSPSSITGRAPADAAGSGFDVAFAGASEGYFSGTAPMTYTTATVNGNLYYVFRTYNKCLGSITFDVT